MILHVPPSSCEAVAEPGEDGPDRVGELMRIIETYNGVTDRLQRTHDALSDQVLRLREQLAAANADLMRSRRLAALGEMAAGIAHEVRNPLASIQLYARMLQQDLAHRPEQREIAEKIVAATRGLNGVVCDVLAFAREAPVNPERRPLIGTVEAAIDSLRPAIDAAGVQTVEDIDEWIDPPHDRELVRRAMVNLIRNAVEAMPNGGWLTIRAVGTGDAATITVRDTGPGIPEEAIDRIFNPFFTTRAAGTGLGLAIVHRIVDAHGGSIAVHNDGGAVFTLTLPGNAGINRQEAMNAKEAVL